MPAPLTAVVADDDMDVRALVARRLRGAKFDVTEAADGRQALELALDGRPDLVVLDAMMPGLDGFAVAQRLRENGLLCGILILSARGQASDLRRGYDVGADDYIIKPFDGGDLVRRALDAANRWRGAAGEARPGPQRPL